MATLLDDVYHVTFGVTSNGKLMVTADGKTEEVRDSLHAYERTLTLRLGPGPSTQEPSWPDLAAQLGALQLGTTLDPPFYTLALASPATLSGTGSTMEVATTAKSKLLASALENGGSLVVTLKKSGSEQSPAWEAVAEVLASLGAITYTGEMTCVGDGG